MNTEIDTLCESWSVTTFRPKVWSCSEKSVLASEVPLAVVMQGPLKKEDAFTEETLRLYRATFPGAQLILSTWENEDSAALRRIEELGVTVIKNSLPKNPGPYHVNYQIKSTVAGLEEAKRLGVSFAMKTRTDNRYCASNAGDYLYGLWKSFPVQDGVSRKGRLLILDLVTRLYVPHHAADIMMFGHIDDMHSYWSLPPSNAQKPLNGMRVLGDLREDYVPEVYLCENYLKLCNQPCDRTLENWWRVLADFYLVVDRSTLGFFWPKHSYGTEHSQTTNDEVRNLALCSMRDWFNIALFDKQCPMEFEDIADQPLHELLS